MAKIAFHNLTRYSAACPYPGARRPEHDPIRCQGGNADRCAGCARQSYGKVKTADAHRLVYSAGSRPVCRICLLPGSVNVDRSHPAFLQRGHVVPVVLFGSNNCTNVVLHHTHCNGAAADRDLSEWHDMPDRPWESAARCAAWMRTPHARYVPDECPEGVTYTDDMRRAHVLPNTAAMDAAREDRGLPF